MYDILTIGDIKLDTFIVLPDASIECELKMPDCKLCIAYGKKIPVQEIASQIAGSAPNVAIALAKMGKKTAVFSIMGHDATHTLALEFLKQHKVSTDLIKTVKNRPSSFAAVLNYKGETTQLVAAGDIEYQLPKRLPPIKWLHISELGTGYEKLYRAANEYHEKRGIKLSLNPGAVQLQERRLELLNLIASADVLFLNMAEARQLLKTQNDVEIHNLLAKLKKMGPKIVVVTAGRDGAYAYNGKQIDYAPMFPGERVEATGAGDAFASGFLGALLHGKGAGEALKWGAVNAASVVGQVGPTKGLLSHTEIMKRLKARPSYKIVEL